MIALGIPATINALEGLAPAKPKPKRRKKERKEPQEPTRHSSRLAGEEAEGTASELALFVINDECPRCGKVQTKGHKQHLAHCTGKPQRPPRQEEEEDLAQDEEDEEELAEVQVSKEAERLQQMDEKLKSLQLNGLIDFSDKAAKFVVLGSTKNHYIVTLSDDRHACQCVDFRIRKHQCKHIRLVLTQLDIADKPSSWHDAVEAKVGQVLHVEKGHKEATGPKNADPAEPPVSAEKQLLQEEDKEQPPKSVASIGKPSARRKLPKSMQH
ncbi:g2989 [Coccomyxa elongata]